MPDSSEAWAAVRNALQNSAYNSTAEFNALPRMVQKAVGSANQLHTWAVDKDYNESVISSVFKKSYDIICQRELAYMELSPQQKKGVEKLSGRLASGEDLREIINKTFEKGTDTFKIGNKNN